MQYTFILNPAAANGAAGKRRHTLEEALRLSGIDYELCETQGPGHAARLAHAAAMKRDVVVAVGGDGTIQEVSRGIISSGRNVHLGVIPVGTGNDFVKMTGMPRDIKGVILAMTEAKPVAVDYGLVRWREGSEEKETVFVNAVGMGFDAQVADEVAAFKFLPGVVGYLAAVMRTLRNWRSPQVRIYANLEGDPDAVLYEGPLFLNTAGNGVSSGGGFYLTPHASITDGLLDICVIRAIPVWRVFQLIPRALRGKHITAPEVEMHRLNSFRLHSESPLFVHADGEVLTKMADEVSVALAPGGLSVLFPG